MTLPPLSLWLKSFKNTFHKEGKKLVQKTINQNKLQTILCIIALTLGVLVSAVLFSMPPVHASNGFVDSIPESHKSFTFFCSNTFELYNEKNAQRYCLPVYY